MITQSEANFLINMKKKKYSNQTYNFPLAGETLTIPIVSDDDRESFLIDVNRGKIKLAKCTCQERYEIVITLVRLDIDGRPHTNPDVQTIPLNYLEPYNGHTIDCPHLHLYVEGYMDKWAIPAPIKLFKNTADLYATLHDFLTYCNIVQPPVIQKGLFL